MAVDMFGDEDAWQWYIARIVALLGYPHSILDDELLGSAGYPTAEKWAAIDDKREQLLDTALRQFGSERGDLLEELLAKLTELQQIATGDAHSNRRRPIEDGFGRLTKRVSGERVLRAEGRIRLGEPPDVSPRHEPQRGR
jgi:hypothetical protein